MNVLPNTQDKTTQRARTSQRKNRYSNNFLVITQIDIVIHADEGNDHWPESSPSPAFASLDKLDKPVPSLHLLSILKDHLCLHPLTHVIAKGLGERLLILHLFLNKCWEVVLSLCFPLKPTYFLLCQKK